MKRIIIATFIAALGIALAQVPITRWHNNAAFELPAGAHTTTESMCSMLKAAVGQEAHERAACLLWGEHYGGALYSLFTMQAQAAGYVIADERVLPATAPLPGVMLVLVDERHTEVVFVMYHGDAMAMVAFTDDR